MAEFIDMVSVVFFFFQLYVKKGGRFESKEIKYMSVNSNIYPPKKIRATKGFLFFFSSTFMGELKILIFPLEERKKKNVADTKKKINGKKEKKFLSRKMGFFL